MTPDFSMLVIISPAHTSSVNFSILLSLGVLLLVGCAELGSCDSCSGVVVVRINAVSASLAVALLVEEAWSIVMVLTCFAFGARTFQVVLAEQRHVSHCLASWRCSAFAAACTAFAIS